MASPEDHQRAVSLVDRAREHLGRLHMSTHGLDQLAARRRMNDPLDAQKLISARVQQRR